MKSLGIFPLDDGVNENFVEKRVEIIKTEQIIEEEVEKRREEEVLNKNENAEIFLEENKENIEHFSTKAGVLSNIKEFSEEEENTSTPENVNKEGKGNGSNKEHPNELKSAKKILPRSTRLSIPKIRSSLVPPSEPDLQRNKPSRIAGNKRFSISKLNQAQIATQIPRLLCAVMTPIKKVPSNDKKSPLPSPNKRSPSPKKNPPSSSTSCTNETDDKKVKKVESKKETNTRKSLPMPTTRKSMLVLPTNKRLSIIEEKNPSIALSLRGPTKSGIVKTTLNSPAIKRNIRKSLAMPTPSRALGNEGRKSIFPAMSKNSNLQAPTSPSRVLDNIKGRKSIFPATTKNSNLQVPTASVGRGDLKTPPEINGKNKAKDTLTKPPSTSTLNHENFFCNKCFRTFRLLSTLETHKKTHSTVLNKLALKCKHCDKKFEVPIALENHLLEKCTKILASERRKLLPKISSSSIEKSTSKGNNNLGNGKDVGSDSTRSNKSIGPFVNKSENDNDSENMPPPSSAASS